MILLIASRANKIFESNRPQIRRLNLCNLYNLWMALTQLKCVLGLFFLLSSSVTDQPTTTTSICLEGKKKRVVDYYFAPRELEQLEDEIDRLLGLYQFIGPL